MSYLRIVGLVLLIWMIALPFNSQGQELVKSVEKIPYYIDINKANASYIHSIQKERLSLQYFDAYGKADELLLKILNWKREEVATVSLAKQYGLNHFNITLSDVYQGWEINKTYSCITKDEAGKKYEVVVKILPPPTVVAPAVDILVNPVTLRCDDISGNLVEFYGEIKGGKAPYVVNWFIMNNTRNDFLYQPREEKIARAGKTLMVEVDKAPDYYVLLKVKDACGGEQQKMVHLMCKQDLKKVSTVFVEPITLPVANKIR